MIKESFTTTCSGFELDFHRFYNDLNELQYVASYKSGTKDEVMLLMAKDITGQWCFLFKEYVPEKLSHLEAEIGMAIERNEF